MGGLYLSGNNLSGEIPPELGNLSNLARLWLHNNNLSGDIPSELGNLPRLTSLVIENNFFTFLPDLSHLNFDSQSQHSYRGLHCRNNYFTFHSLEPNSEHLPHNYRYAPQRRFELEETVFNYDAGSTITLNAKDMAVLELGGANNRYALYKDGELIQSPSAEWEFTIENASDEDSGAYRFLVTNTQLTGLSLWSEYFYLNIEGSIAVSSKEIDKAEVEKNESEDIEAFAEPLVAKVYPNPSDGSFYISLEDKYTGPVRVIIRNSMGNEIQTKYFEKNMEVETYPITITGPAGIYFAEIIMGQNTEALTFIVK